MATDSFDREIDYLRVSVTDKCNLGCVYCMPGRRPENFESDKTMSTAELLRIVDIASRRFGVRKVRLTGGEPLLRPDIVEIVAAISAMGIGDLSVTTNGHRLSEMAGALKAAGLRRLNISLDSMNPDLYKTMTDGGRLETVLRGIKAAEDEGLNPIKINMVPIRGMNDGEIVDFARMTMEKPVHIRFIEFMPSGREKLWSSGRCVTSQEVLDAVKAAFGTVKKLPFRGKGPSRNYRIEGAKGVIGLISPMSHGFCYCCNRLRLSALGRLRPCLFSSTEIDLLTPMRQGASDDEVARLVELAIRSKPEGNYLKDPSGASISSMSSIGG